MSPPASTPLITYVLASHSQQHGPAYFFTAGPTLLAMGLIMTVSPPALTRFNSRLAKSATIRALARARSGTDVSNPNPTRVRTVGVIAILFGAAALAWGIAHA